MTVSTDTLRLLIEAGLSGERLLAVVESIERDNAKPEGPSKGAERTRRWRARLEATGLTTDEWRALSASVIARDKGVCQYCGTTRGRMQCDHINPLAQGGGNSEDNLVCACPACNGGKTGQTLEEWKGERWAAAWRHHRGTSRDITGDVTAGHHTGHHDGDARPLPLPLSPQTPLTPTHTPPEVSTRARTPAAKATRRCPPGWEPKPATLSKLASEGYGQADLDRALTMLRDHEFKTARSDWDATYRNWVRNKPPTRNHERPRSDQASAADARAERRSVWGDAAEISGRSRAG